MISAYRKTTRTTVTLHLLFVTGIIIALLCVEGFTFERNKHLSGFSFLKATASGTIVDSWQETTIGSFSTVSSLVDHQLSASVGERIKCGESVIQLPSTIIDPEECEGLVHTCIEIASETSENEVDKRGLVRLPTISAAARAATTNTPCADPLPKEIDRVLEDILYRVTQYIDEKLPSIVTTLFDENYLLTDLLMRDKLHYSSREPAINVYFKGGEFLAHKDAQALTVLIPLSTSPAHFEGGGTAFWSQDARGHRVEDPSLVLTPATAGTALLFGGCVTHAGQPILSGTRVVFVASFSSKMRGNSETNIEFGQQRDIYGDSM